MSTDEDDDFSQLMERFQDPIITRSVSLLSSVVSSLCLSNPSEPIWKNLKNILTLLSYQESITLLDLKNWLESSYEYHGRNPVDLTASEKDLKNEQTIYQNLFYMTRSGRLNEAMVYAQEVLKRPWLAIVISPALLLEAENSVDMSLWKTTLTSSLSLNGGGNLWQRGFYGALSGDIPSVEAILDSSDYLGGLWNLVNSAVKSHQTSRIFFHTEEGGIETFDKLLAVIAHSLLYQDFDGILKSIYSFLTLKEEGTLDLGIVAIIHTLIPLLPIVKSTIDPIISKFIDLWMGRSTLVNIRDTILKFPYIALVKDQAQQQSLLSHVLFEECLSLDREEIFRVKTNCKKYFPHNFESTLQLMLQRALSQVDDPRLLLNLVYFTLFPLLLVHRQSNQGTKSYPQSDLFTLELVVALARKFLASEQLSYYKSLLGAVDDSTDSLDPDNAFVREYACYIHLLKLLLVYEDWNNELLKEPKVNPEAEGFERILWERQHAHWKHQVDALKDNVKHVYKHTFNISEGIEWMDQQAIINYPAHPLLTTENERQREAQEARSVGKSIMQSILENISKNQ